MKNKPIIILYTIPDMHHGYSYQSGNDREFLSIFRFWIEKPAYAMTSTFLVLSLKSILKHIVGWWVEKQPLTSPLFPFIKGGILPSYICLLKSQFPSSFTQQEYTGTKHSSNSLESFFTPKGFNNSHSCPPFCGY